MADEKDDTPEQQIARLEAKAEKLEKLINDFSVHARVQQAWISSLFYYVLSVADDGDRARVQFRQYLREASARLELSVSEEEALLALLRAYEGQIQ